ncbi:hypothetical protein Tco_1233001 [Tanacetum coccineum]
MKEREVEAIKEIKKRLNEQKMQTQESLVTEGAVLKASLITEGIALEDNLVAKESTYDSVPSSEQLDESNILGNDGDAEKILVETVASDIENTDIEPSYDSDTMSEVHHDTFENVFAHRIQNHNQPESIPNTHAVNENNSDIISDIPNMDLVRDKEEHDFVDDEHQRAFSASLVKNLKSKVENCTKVNREAQQANALLTKELEKYKEKEKHLSKETTNESEYCKKIKLLNEEISNLKSQACQKEKSFHKENEKYAQYVKPLLNRKNELEKTNQEFLKQINDLKNKLLKIGHTAQTLHMLLPKEDNVNTRKKGLGFEIQNNFENPFILNKSKRLTPSLYNIDEMGKDLLSDHKIISEEELKCEGEKSLKVKQRKSPLSYHGFVYGETQFEEPPKVSLKRKDVNLKKHLEQAQLRNHDPKLWKSILMKLFCYVKQSMLKFERQTVSKLALNKDDWFQSYKKSYEDNIYRISRN